MVKAFAGSSTSSQSMLANGGWALWFGRQSQMNVVPVSVGNCRLDSLVGMQPRPRTAFQTALATVIPVSVGRSNRGGGCSGGGRVMLAPNTAFQLTRAVWRSTRSGAFWQVVSIHKDR